MILIKSVKAKVTTNMYASAIRMCTKGIFGTNIPSDTIAVATIISRNIAKMSVLLGLELEKNLSSLKFRMFKRPETRSM